MAMRSLLKFKNIVQNSKRCVSSSNISPNLPPNLRKAYEKFQKDDGIPVYLKGGPGDRILLGVTVIVIAVGVVDGLYTLTRLDVRK